MEKKINLDTQKDRDILRQSKAGDFLYLSGKLLSARDAAHSRLLQIFLDKREGKEITQDNIAILDKLKNRVIYYMGPSPTREGFSIGSCGPTSSYRMDSFLEITAQIGVIATIGKGDRADFINNIIAKYKMPYLITIGGAAAYLASCVISATIIAFEELGTEALRELEVKDFPIIVALDMYGNSIFQKMSIEV